MWKPARLFFLLVITLSVAGLFFVFEASTVESFRLFGHPYHFVRTQALWLLLATVAFVAVRWLRLEWLEKWALPLYVLATLVLLLTLIPPFGVKLNGASRWLLMPWGGTLQPIELFKLAMINFYALLLSRKTNLRSFLFFLLWPALILLLQPDFGSLMILVATCLAMYFLSGAKLQKLGWLASAGFVAAVLVVIFSPYRRERLMTFLEPEQNVQGQAYHVKQITLALGAGSLFGRGIGNSLQKHAYVPEASSDSIFAIIAEEIGFVGALVLLLLFILYFVSADRMLRAAELGQYQFLLAYGLLVTIAVQLLFNLAAIVVLLPLSGMPLPFFSQGGSSLLSVMISSGLLLNIAQNDKMKAPVARRNLRHKK